MYKRGTIGSTLTGFPSPHFCAGHKRGRGFPTPYAVVVFLVLYVFR